MNNNILNEKEFYKELRQALSLQLLERAEKLGLIDTSSINKIIKELSKAEVINYAI